MESEDNNQLFHKEEKYRSWLLEETSRQNNHDCFDIPTAKDETAWFDFQDKLMEAAMHGCTECLDKLIKAGANVNKTGEYKVTALMWASRYGHPDCVNLLLEAVAFWVTNPCRITRKVKQTKMYVCTLEEFILVDLDTLLLQVGTDLHWKML